MRELDEKAEIDDTFTDDHVLSASKDMIQWSTNFPNYLDRDTVPLDLSFIQRKKFMHDAQKFFWDKSYLYRSCADGLIRHCVPEAYMFSVLAACYSTLVGGHHSGIRTTQKILQCGYYWPTVHQDAHDFSKASNICQRDGVISRK